jgi:hypothetical protein
MSLTHDPEKSAAFRDHAVQQVTRRTADVNRRSVLGRRSLGGNAVGGGFGNLGLFVVGHRRDRRRGKKREQGAPACSITARRDNPPACRRSANSTVKMPCLEMRPIEVTRPIRVDIHARRPDAPDGRRNRNAGGVQFENSGLA